MNMQFKDFDDAEKWENRDLGASAEHAKPAPKEVSEQIDDSLGLVPLSMRLQKSLIDDLKELAKEQGLGYQPFIRQILTKHVKAAKENRLVTS